MTYDRLILILYFLIEAEPIKLKSNRPLNRLKSRNYSMLAIRTSPKKREALLRREGPSQKPIVKGHLTSLREGRVFL